MKSGSVPGTERETSGADLAGHWCAMQRRAKRGAVVAGGRLHVDFVEQAGARQLSVRAAIQSHPARQSDFPQARSGAKMAADVQNRAIKGQPEALLRTSRWTWAMSAPGSRRGMRFRDSQARVCR